MTRKRLTRPTKHKVIRELCMIQARNAQFFARVGVVALSLMIGASAALASGGGGGSGGSGTSGTPACKHAKDPRCKSGSLEDQNRYQRGRALALAGHYDEALRALNA